LPCAENKKSRNPAGLLVLIIDASNFLLVPPQALRNIRYGRRIGAVPAGFHTGIYQSPDKGTGHYIQRQLEALVLVVVSAGIIPGYRHQEECFILFPKY
jgi:hypothetical protein